MLTTTFVASLGAADLSGAWTLELDPDFGGNPDQIECTFKQNGPKLTIACGGGPTVSGDVDRSRVTFAVPTGRNNELRALFTGELDPREITITGTWELADDAGKRNGQFTARKYQPQPISNQLPNYQITHLPNSLSGGDDQDVRGGVG